MKWPISWSDVKDHIDDIEDGIDPKLLPEGGVGYAKNHVFTFNGDTTGKYVAPNSTPEMVKISDTVIDPKTITKVEVTVYGTITEFSGSDIICEESEYGGYEIYAIVDGQKIQGCAVVLPDNEAKSPQGLYVVNDTTGESFGAPGYVSRVEYETVHKIDKKFLPDDIGGGGGLPVVDLTGFEFDLSQSMMITDEASVIQLEVAKESPGMIAKIVSGGLWMNTLFLSVDPTAMGMDSGYAFIDSANTMRIAGVDGEWVIGVMSGG